MSPQQIVTLCQNHNIKLELTEDGKLEAIGQLTEELRTVIKEHVFDLKFYLLKQASISRLPFKLERLVSAATNNQLSFYIRDIPDVNSYVMAWACAYLVGDQQEALNRLNEILELRERVMN